MRQVIILGVLLAGSLALAWTVHTDDTEIRDAEAVAIYTDPTGNLDAIGWADDEGTVRVETRSDAKGDYLWVTVAEQVAIPIEVEADTDLDTDGMATVDMNPDADSDADSDMDSDVDTAAPIEPEYETVVRGFKGNQQASELLLTFSPLYALRDLSEGASSSAFGLDDPTATLTVVVSGTEQRFTVGGETFGAKDRYVGTGDRVYLVDDAALRPLQFAKTRLVERALFPLEPGDIASIEVRADTRRAVWTHQNRDDRGADYWAIEGTPDEPVDTTKSWMRKLLAVRAQAYVDADTVDVEMAPVFAYTVRGDDTSWTVDVMRETTGGDNPRWFARTEYNRSLVELTRSLATDAFVDVDAVLP